MSDPKMMESIAREEMQRANALAARLHAKDAALAEAQAAIARLTGERDLAIAHDRQPYPTAEAYELVCAARTKWQERAEAAEARVSTLEEALGDVAEYVRHAADEAKTLAVIDAALATDQPQEPCSECGGTGHQSRIGGVWCSVDAGTPPYSTRSCPRGCKPQEPKT